MALKERGPATDRMCDSYVAVSLQLLLDYSSSSPKGEELVEYLSHRRNEVTLFVPHNAGFAPNQVTSRPQDSTGLTSLTEI